MCNRTRVSFTNGETCILNDGMEYVKAQLPQGYLIVSAETKDSVYGKTKESEVILFLNSIAKIEPWN